MLAAVLVSFQGWVFAAFLAGMQGQGEGALADPCADQGWGRRASNKQSAAETGSALPYNPGTAWSFYVAFRLSSYRPLIYYWDLKSAA